MDDPIKKQVFEPRIFSLLVRTIRGEFLYIGVHFFLEEAYTAASIEVTTLLGAAPTDPVEICLWSSLPARDVMNQVLDPVKISDIIKLPVGISPGKRKNNNMHIPEEDEKPEKKEKPMPKAIQDFVDWKRDNPSPKVEAKGKKKAKKRK